MSWLPALLAAALRHVPNSWHAPCTLPCSSSATCVACPLPPDLTLPLPTCLPTCLPLPHLQVKRNSAALVKYRQMYIPRGVPPAQPAGTPLFLNRVYKHLQAGWGFGGGVGAGGHIGRWHCTWCCCWQTALRLHAATMWVPLLSALLKSALSHYCRPPCQPTAAAAV
jgi:hypothetical protein